MKKIIFLLGLCYSSQLYSQRIYSRDEISRLADLGKVWGILQNFHPEMARGTIKTDSLVVDLAASLSNDPSEANFKVCLQTMLSRLRDPLTHVVKENKTAVKLLSTNDKLPSYHLLKDSVLYVAFPTAMAGNDTVRKLSWLKPQQLGRYKGLIIDLRNTAPEPYGDYFFSSYFEDSLLRETLSKPVNLPAELYRYQAGFISQATKTIHSNIYSAGWQIFANDQIVPMTNSSLQHANVVFVINSFISDDLFKYLLALQSGGCCKINFDGKAEDYRNGSTIDYYTDPDSLLLKIRVSEYIMPGGNMIPPPDLLIAGIEDGSAFMEKCRELALEKSITTNERGNNGASLNYIHPFPNGYEESAFVPVGLRLFGLYNYWNAIQYFNPNRPLLKENWDSVLIAFIPRFINATDTLSYYFVIRDLVSHIHDSHGFFTQTPKITSLIENYRYTANMTVTRIQQRYYITAIGKDSLQNLSKFHLWDEITAINGIPVNEWKQQFRSRFAASNDWVFERDMCNLYLLSGAHDSLLRLRMLRDGKSVTGNLKLTSLDFRRDDKAVSFNDDHKDIELLNGNIGYVNMGTLPNERVDLMIDSLMNTKAIIFDIRNYPRGTAWSIVPRLTNKDSIAVKFETPYVTYNSIYTPELPKVQTDFFKVTADKSKPYYHGKIIILCNAKTQSQAEYTIMMFQGAAGKRVTVIGSATAGADGNVMDITLPGGYATDFSGLGVPYPDGTQTQQKGIHVDIHVEPTVAGLKAGKDEVLERAVQFIETGK